MKQQKLLIEHDEHAQVFTLGLEDGDVARLEYRLVGQTESRTIDLFSTYVPLQHRGKHLGAKLVNHALEWAEQGKLNVFASCWYAAKLLQRREKSSKTTS